MRAHEHGAVALRVLVDAQGVPRQIHLARSSGFPRLDRSAAEAVQHYRFSPPARQTPDGAAWTTVTVDFDLLRMPVPTAVVRFDASLAQQIAVAKSSKSGFRLDILNMTPRMNQLASHLLDSLLQRDAKAAAPEPPHTIPTPIEQLTALGRLRWFRFVGFADRSFDCGTVTAPADLHDARCEIFEAQQASGTSYWLGLVADGGTQLENLAVTAEQPLHAVNLR